MPATPEQFHAVAEGLREMAHDLRVRAVRTNKRHAEELRSKAARFERAARLLDEEATGGDDGSCS